MRLAASLFAMSALAYLIAAPTGARADAIDVHWCNGTSKRLFIDGPTIVTPGGTKMQGDYDRHGFAYQVPAGEPGAGGTTTMTILSDEEMHLRPAGSAESSIEVWVRCRAPVS